MNEIQAVLQEMRTRMAGKVGEPLPKPVYGGELIEWANRIESFATPACPACGAALLYECPACSETNYPPPQPRGEGMVLNASIVREAADVLEAVGASGVPLPDNWRWPLADELSGISAMLVAAPENTP